MKIDSYSSKEVEVTNKFLIVAVPLFRMFWLQTVPLEVYKTKFEVNKTTQGSIFILELSKIFLGSKISGKAAVLRIL